MQELANISLFKNLTPQDLAPYPVISQPTNSALSHLYDAWFAEQGMPVKRVLTCNSLGMMAQLTMLGLGISYLPGAYFAPLVARGALCRARPPRGRHDQARRGRSRG